MNLNFSEYCISEFKATCDYLRNNHFFTSLDKISLEFTTIDETPSPENEPSNITDQEENIDDAHEWLQTVFSQVKDLIKNYFHQTRHHVIYEILITVIAIILFIAYKMSQTEKLPRRRTRRKTNKNRKRHTRNRSKNTESS